MEDTTRYELGLRTLETLFGPGVEETALENGDVGRLLIEFGLGTVFSRPGMSLREREIANIAMLVGMGDCQQQLRYHIGAALRLGMSPAELEELLLNMVVNGGFARVLNAMKLLREVLAEHEGGTSDRAA